VQLDFLLSMLYVPGWQAVWLLDPVVEKYPASLSYCVARLELPVQ
jgi:hypothetical protein